MRILHTGHAHWTKSGYGTQWAYLMRAFQELGHTVFSMPHYGFQGAARNIDGVEYLPLHRDGWGHDIVGQHVRNCRIDAVFSFHDCWTLKPSFPQSFDVPWITYSPVDSIPVMPVLARILREASHVAAMSRFGQVEMRKRGIESTYIPHGIDTDIFRPGDKREAREALGINRDKFICLIAAANAYYPSRKAFPEQMAAFAEFHKEFPDSELLFHTAMIPANPGAGGLDINELVRNLGLQGCTANTEDYDICMGLPDEQIALMYRAADVLLGASYAEGFGLMQAECQACGTPVIVHDFAASPEFLFGGIKVSSAQQFWNLGGCWQAIPSIPAITQALREVYANREEYTELGLAAAKRVQSELSQVYVRDTYWKPLLEKVEAKDILPEESKAVAAD
jgi:glycosyltransferase involved in cell wall biosynthesis